MTSPADFPTSILERILVFAARSPQPFAHLLNYLYVLPKTSVVVQRAVIPQLPWCSLHQASGRGNLAALCWWRFDAKLPLHYDEEPIDLACEHGHTHVLDWWLCSGLELKYGARAIDRACFAGRTHVLDWWMGSGLAVAHSDDVLSIASAQGHTAVLEWWQRSGLPFTFTAEALVQASSAGQIAVLEWWREYAGARQLRYPSAAFRGACVNGHVGVLQWWMDAGSYPRNDVVAEGAEEAALRGHVHVLDWLLRTETCTAWRRQILENAAQLNQVRILEWWRASGITIEYKPARILTLASRYGSVDVLEWWRAQADLKFEYDESALDLASRNGQIAVLDWWLHSGLELKYAPEMPGRLDGRCPEAFEWWARSGLRFMARSPYTGAITMVGDGAEAQVEISLSVEETNKLRASLGLKPLVLTSSDADVRAAANFAAQSTTAARTREAAEVAKRLERSRNRRKLRETLVGATLGDGEADEDAAAWVARQKAMAARTRATIEEAESVSESAAAAAKRRWKARATAAVSGGDEEEYTARDLAGLSVAHDLEADLVEGQEMILTLKDTGVLDDGEDELENATLRDVEKAREALAAKSKRPGYSGYDDDELETMTMGSAAPARRGVLAQYDEFIDEVSGKAKAPARRYVLGEDGAQIVKGEQPTAEEMLEAKALSLEYEKQKQIDDFKSASEMTIKKKKKSKKNQRRTKLDPDAITDAVVTNRDRDFSESATTSFVDDDDLQSMLTATRARAVRRRAKALPSVDEVALDLERNAAATPTNDMDVDGDAADEDGTLVFDATTEFVRSIDTAAADAAAHEAEVKIKREHDAAQAAAAAVDDDMELDEVDAILLKTEPASTTIKQEHTDEADDADDQHNPLEEEPVLNKGLGAAMELFRKRGALDVVDADRAAREREYQARQQWEQNATAGAGGGKAKTNKRKPEDMAERLKNYKPNVVIEHYNAQGRLLTAKEAYKELSHPFHGRKGGKNKQEKIARKDEERRRQEQMASGDRLADLTTAMLERQKVVGAPGILLTEGNRPVSAGPSLQEPLAKKPRHK
ncbi:hypothetical protein H9P43_000246 [Blastocladiella emersonii ATCC 22665]|nr:hypothetical protein H9P43_000246 [Blastocladiella emersonii ATCC 22665]